MSSVAISANSVRRISSHRVASRGFPVNLDFSRRSVAPQVRLAAINCCNCGASTANSRRLDFQLCRRRTGTDSFPLGAGIEGPCKGDAVAGDQFAAGNLFRRRNLLGFNGGRAGVGGWGLPVAWRPALPAAAGRPASLGSGRPASLGSGRLPPSLLWAGTAAFAWVGTAPSPRNATLVVVGDWAPLQEGTTRRRTTSRAGKPAGGRQQPAREEDPKPSFEQHSKTSRNRLSASNQVDSHQQRQGQACISK